MSLCLIDTGCAVQVSAQQQSEVLAMSDANGAAMADLLSALDTAMQNGESPSVVAYDMQEQGVACTVFQKLIVQRFTHVLMKSHGCMKMRMRQFPHIVLCCRLNVHTVLPSSVHVATFGSWQGLTSRLDGCLAAGANGIGGTKASTRAKQLQANDVSPGLPSLVI